MSPGSSATPSFKLPCFSILDYIVHRSLSDGWSVRHEDGDVMLLSIIPLLPILAIIVIIAMIIKNDLCQFGLVVMWFFTSLLIVVYQPRW